MNSRKLNFLALAVAAFAMACSDPTMPTRRLALGSTSAALIPVEGYPFPSTNTFGDGVVRLCKISDVAGTFDFDVTTPSGATSISITVDPGEEDTAVCYPTVLFNSDAAGNVAQTVTIVEDDPGAGVTVDIDINQYYTNSVNYAPVNPLGDTFNNDTRTATVVINDDLEKLVTFTNTSPEDQLCTLTQGYWKNHTLDWPAAAGFGPGSAFFGTGITYQQAITIEQDGNAFFILSRQYVAALLNKAAGASVPAEVQDALDDATALFAAKLNTVGPTNQQGRATWITLAGILDQYNRGLIGPGKCTG